MKHMGKRIILIGTLVLIVLIVGGGLFFWNMMQEPLYTPGMVRAGTNLRAPLVPLAPSANKDAWNVESDIQLHHFSQGTGGQNVLIIHGGPGEPFDKAIPALEPLKSRYTFHYYDQRGCGQSSRPIVKFASSNYWENMQTLDKTLGLGAQIADVERIRQILGEDKLIIIGHSFGGFLAALYAAEFPEHVKMLVLVAPAELLVMPPESGGLFEEIKPFLPQETQAEYDAYLKRALDYGSVFSKSETDLAAMNAEFARYYGLAASRKGFSLPATSSATSGGGWMVEGMYMSMGLKHDYRSALGSVKAPVLVLHGERDFQPEKATRMYVDALPNAAFGIVPNAGHFIFDDQPEAFARAVGEFLDASR